MEDILISKEKLHELKEQLQDLHKTLVRDNEEATKMGGPMDSFKEAAAFQVTLGAKRNKIKELTEIVTKAKVLPDVVPGDLAVIGKWVELDNGINTIKYRLVHPVEADPSRNLISTNSPLGRELLNHKAGFAFTLNSRRFKILSVT
jgi:transcription elongation factor GreA